MKIAQLFEGGDFFKYKFKWLKLWREKQFETVFTQMENVFE